MFVVRFSPGASFLGGRLCGLFPADFFVPGDPVPGMGGTFVVVKVDRVSPDITDIVCGAAADMEDEGLEVDEDLYGVA